MHRLATGLLALALSGCFETGYLLQAGEGQLDLVCRARNIDSVLDDPETPPEVKQQLEEVPRIKAFALDVGLVPTKSYEDFVALDRPVAVWVVSAAPPLSFESKTWTFPIVGSVPYLGWFDKIDARTHARELAAEGWDVDLRGASAYSTLGWFRDPVLSSMLGDGTDATGALAEVILHESLHATVYVKGQSSFNEGLATFVGDHLAVKYLAKRYGEGSTELSSYVEGEEQGKKRAERLRRAFEDLDALYRSKLPRAEKLARKKEYLTGLASELHMRRMPTNATLAGFRAYHGGSKSFEALYEACGSDVGRMVAAAKLVKESDFPAAQATELDGVVARIAERGCKATSATPTARR
jgi:predicted aminopeptidase